MKKWTKKVAECGDKEQIYLRLLDEKNRNLSLCAVDYKGNIIEQGTILCISNKVLIAPQHLNKKIPLKTDLKDSALLYPSWMLPYSGSSLMEVIMAKAMMDKKDKSSDDE